jgi:hypothetical protein
MSRQSARCMKMWGFSQSWRDRTQVSYVGQIATISMNGRLGSFSCLHSGHKMCCWREYILKHWTTRISIWAPLVTQYTSRRNNKVSFMNSRRKKSRGVKSGERGNQRLAPPLKTLCPLKWGGALCCRFGLHLNTPVALWAMTHLSTPSVCLWSLVQGL